jgi:predicted regulator of Ras-like GTPase activity (Roadblock/LC7/MglB family)
MDAAQALADLTEISSQISAATLIDSAGKVAASTLADAARADDFARAARDLLEAADGVRQAGGEALTQLEVATTEGSVFIVREGETTIAATTSPEPTVGLVFYDLKSCLRSVAEPDSEAKPDATAEKKAEPKRARKKAEPAAEAETESEPERIQTASADGDPGGGEAEPGT